MAASTSTSSSSVGRVLVEALLVLLLNLGCAAKTLSTLLL